jgi:hypothetical protein
MQFGRHDVPETPMGASRKRSLHFCLVEIYCANAAVIRRAASRGFFDKGCAMNRPFLLWRATLARLGYAVRSAL